MSSFCSPCFGLPIGTRLTSWRVAPAVSYPVPAALKAGQNSCRLRPAASECHRISLSYRTAFPSPCTPSSLPAHREHYLQLIKSNASSPAFPPTPTCQDWPILHHRWLCLGCHLSPHKVSTISAIHALNLVSNAGLNGFPCA